MKNNQDYYLEQIEQIANEQGYNTYLSKDYANCGWIIFRTNTNDCIINTKSKKLYFDFQSDYGDIRLKNGNMYDGVYFEYTNARDEKKLYNFIFNFLED